MASGFADLILVAEHEHHQQVVTRLDGDQVFAAVEGDRADRRLASQRLAHHGERFGGDLAVGRQVVRLLEKHGINRGRRGELVQVDDARRLRPDLGDVLLLERDVTSLLELVPLHDLVVRNFALMGRTPLLVLDAGQALPVQLVEMDCRAGIRRRVDADGDRHQAQPEVPFPECACSHVDLDSPLSLVATGVPATEAIDWPPICSICARRML
jgi:hypothetical protein